MVGVVVGASEPAVLDQIREDKLDHLERGGAVWRGRQWWLGKFSEGWVLGSEGW